MKRLLIIAILIGSVPGALAQNVNGFWKGTLNMAGGCFAVNNIELQIHLTGDSAAGDSYHYLDIDNYVKKNFKGTYSDVSKKVVLQEDVITTYKIRSNCIICVKKYNLAYSRKGNQEFLTGTWTGKIMGSFADCGPDTIVLSRIKESAFKEVPEIAVDTGQIRLDFYDNNEIDGDSITVLVNGKTILTHQRLSAKPITAFVTVDLNNKFQEVAMVAENEGTIPPNTALLIVTAGEKRYELFMASTEEKSARVRFVYDPVRLKKL